MKGNNRERIGKIIDTSCRSIIDVCEVDPVFDYGPEMEQTRVSMARRMSITKVLARRSVAWARYSIERLPIRLTLANLGFVTVSLAVILPRAITYQIIYPLFRLVFGTLYPAYASYKAVRTKNVKEYVKWMMYWIVFALFTCAETFTDVFFSFWFPFYYEIKIILVLWLLSPATKGSSILYRRFVHPALIQREAEIDDALARATEQGYTAVLHLGTKGVNYATTVLMQTAIKNLPNSILNPPSTSLSESQSDPAISSLANRSPSKTSGSPRDKVDGSIRQRSKSQDDDSVLPKISVIAASSEDEHSEDFSIKMEDESSCMIEEFKLPTEKPKNSRKGTRKRNINSRKQTLRSYDEFSDGTDG